MVTPISKPPGKMLLVGVLEHGTLRDIGHCGLLNFILKIRDWIFYEIFFYKCIL